MGNCGDGAAVVGVGVAVAVGCPLQEKCWKIVQLPKVYECQWKTLWPETAALTLHHLSSEAEPFNVSNWDQSMGNPAQFSMRTFCFLCSTIICSYPWIIPGYRQTVSSGGSGGSCSMPWQSEAYCTLALLLCSAFFTPPPHTHTSYQSVKRNYVFKWEICHCRYSFTIIMTSSLDHAQQSANER